MTGMTPATVFPYLSYRDAHAAIDHLVSAFGFTPLRVVGGDDGTVAHAALALDNGVVMLSSAPAEGAEPWQEGPTCICVTVDDLDAHHARAVAAGATVTAGLRDTDYGTRDYTAQDTEGNVWVFGTYQPMAPHSSDATSS
jgi:uncharacterized glyoxalase superfamily protein PhnB